MVNWVNVIVCLTQSIAPLSNRIGGRKNGRRMPTGGGSNTNKQHNKGERYIDGFATICQIVIKWWTSINVQPLRAQTIDSIQSFDSSTFWHTPPSIDPHTRILFADNQTNLSISYICLLLFLLSSLLYQNFVFCFRHERFQHGLRIFLQMYL